MAACHAEASGEASGASDTAGKAARVAVERSGSCRDTKRVRLSVVSLLPSLRDLLCPEGAQPRVYFESAILCSAQIPANRPFQSIFLSETRRRCPLPKCSSVDQPCLARDRAESSVQGR